MKYLHIAAILVNLEALESLMDFVLAGGEEKGLEFLETLSSLKTLCRSHGLELSEMAIQPILDVLSNAVAAGQMPSFVHYEAQVKVIRGRIVDELRIPRFFFIPREKAKYFEELDEHDNLIPPFGKEVQDRFPSANQDIDEAGKCFAAGCNTACVFHLMRVIEVGLGEIKKVLGVTTSSPNWEVMIRELQKAADARVGKDPNWRDPHRFYSDCLAQLRNIKDAWRNPVMHVIERHDEASASSIYEHTKAFMQRLAKPP